MDVDQFIAENQAKINELRAQYGELICIKSGWGPICVMRRPTWAEQMKYAAESAYSESPMVRAWAPVKYVEQVIVLPTPMEFTPIRDKHGYEFVDNLCAELIKNIRPEVATTAKKI